MRPSTLRNSRCAGAGQPPRRCCPPPAPSRRPRPDVVGPRFPFGIGLLVAGIPCFQQSLEFLREGCGHDDVLAQAPPRGGAACVRRRRLRRCHGHTKFSCALRLRVLRPSSSPGFSCAMRTQSPAPSPSSSRRALRRAMSGDVVGTGSDDDGCECIMCMEDVRARGEGHIYQRGHVFCATCWQQLVGPTAQCPTCKTPLATICNRKAEKQGGQLVGMQSRLSCADGERVAPIVVAAQPGRRSSSCTGRGGRGRPRKSTWAGAWDVVLARTLAVLSTMTGWE